MIFKIHSQYSNLGVIFLEQGLSAAEDFYQNIVFKTCHPFKQFWKFHPITEGQSFNDINEENVTDLFHEVEEILKIKFNDKTLLIQVNIYLIIQGTNPFFFLKAFTHPSFYGKNSLSKQKQKHYQRMEFLGDSLLEMCSGIYLYENFPSASEGQMSLCRAQIVNNETLSECIQNLGLHKFLRHNSPYFTFEGPKFQKASADLFESLVAAILLDQGLDTATQFIQTFLLLQKTTTLPDTIMLDPKSFYQHLIQTETREIPSYQILKSTPTKFGTFFEIGLYVKSELLVVASGQTKFEAEITAAKKAIELYLLDDHYFVKLASWITLKDEIFI